MRNLIASLAFAIGVSTAALAQLSPVPSVSDPVEALLIAPAAETASLNQEG